MRISLLGKNILGFINDTCTRGSVEESLRTLWESVNVVVLARIMNTLSKDLLSGVVYSSEAHHVWIDLQERFDQSHGMQVFHLLRQIHTQNQWTMGISQYFSKLRFLYDQLSSTIETPTCSCEKAKKYFEYAKSECL